MRKSIISILFTLLLGTTASARSFTVNITPDSASTLSVFLPDGQPTASRMVIILPGGGYTHLAMQHEGTDWAPYFNSRGMAVGVLKYRMPKGNRRIPMSDAFAAMKMAHDSALVWHVNPNDIGIMGSSAGGHLASVVSTMAPMAIRPAFSILFYPVIAMTERGSHRGSVDNFLGSDKTDKAVVDSFSTNKAVRSHAVPPTVIFLANDDNAVPPVTNGIAYFTAMNREGNNIALYAYPNGGHGFGFRKTFSFHDQLLQELGNWLNNLPQPQPQALKVACIGNSITDGFGIAMKDLNGYPAQLQHKLGNGYIVKNFGVSARTMLNKGDLPYMNEPAWRDALSFSPDIAIVGLGTNDSKPYNWTHKDEFMTDMQQLINRLKALPSHPRIILCTPLPAPNLLNSIQDSVIARDICPLIKKVAKKNKLQLVDFHSTFPSSDGLIQRDLIHPTTKGAGLIADRLREIIVSEKK